MQSFLDKNYSSEIQPQHRHLYSSELVLANRTLVKETAVTEIKILILYKAWG